MNDCVARKSKTDMLVFAMEGSFPPSRGVRSHLDLAAPLLDARCPPADTLGMLADRQIRSHDLAIVAEHVAQNWPMVKSLRCEFANGLFRFFIGISPFSSEAQFKHWPLATWIENELGINDGRYLFVPPAYDEPLSGEIVVV